MFSSFILFFTLDGGGGGNMNEIRFTLRALDKKQMKCMAGMEQRERREKIVRPTVECDETKQLNENEKFIFHKASFIYWCHCCCHCYTQCALCTVQATLYRRDVRCTRQYSDVFSLVRVHLRCLQFEICFFRSTVSTAFRNFGLHRERSMHFTRQWIIIQFPSNGKKWKKFRSVEHLIV